MSDTTATVRKEILEKAKAEIDARIANATDIRDGWKLGIENLPPFQYEIFGAKWQEIVDAMNADIDQLIAEKNDLPDVLFSDRADEIEPTEAEAQALERRLDGLRDGDVAIGKLGGGKTLVLDTNAIKESNRHIHANYAASLRRQGHEQEAQRIEAQARKIK